MDVRTNSSRARSENRIRLIISRRSLRKVSGGLECTVTHHHLPCAPLLVALGFRLCESLDLPRAPQSLSTLRSSAQAQGPSTGRRTRPVPPYPEPQDQLAPRSLALPLESERGCPYHSLLRTAC